MRYPVSNLGRNPRNFMGQANMVLSKDFNQFYQAALGAANGIADVAQSFDLTPEQKAEINRQIGTIRDYTIPLAAAPAPCPPPGAPVVPSNSSGALLLAVGSILAGAAFGYFVL